MTRKEAFMIRKRSKQGIVVIALFLGGLIYHAGFSSEAQDHWLMVRHQDYLHQKLMFDWPSEVTASSLDVDLTVVQPYGFSHRLTAVASRENDTGELEVEFPLLDEGRYGPLPDWRWEASYPGSSSIKKMPYPNGVIAAFGAPDT